MELISKNCKGLMFSLRENGLGYLSAQCIAEVLADNSYYALLGVPPPPRHPLRRKEMASRQWLRWWFGFGGGRR